MRRRACAVQMSNPRVCNLYHADTPIASANYPRLRDRDFQAFGVKGLRRRVCHMFVLDILDTGTRKVAF